jgi:cobalt-zinc-cadmium efflux system outer membrane protein
MNYNQLRNRTDTNNGIILDDVSTRAVISMLQQSIIFACLVCVVGCQSAPRPNRVTASESTATTSKPRNATQFTNASNPVQSSTAIVSDIVQVAVVTEKPSSSSDVKPLMERLPPTAPAEMSVTPHLDNALSLDHVEQLACENNPTLVQARAQIDGTLGKALEAGLWPNPTLGYQAEKIGSQGTAGEFQGGFIQQEFVTAQKRRVSREKYLARAKAAEFLALAQQYRVINDIRRLYWRTVGAARLVTIHEQILRNSEDRLATSEEKFNVGQANAVDVRRARIQVQRAKLELRMVTNDRDQTRRELSAFVGAGSLSEALVDLLDQQLPEIAWESALTYTLSESPELREASATLESDRITIDRERRQPIPNIFVKGGPGYDYTQGQTVANVQVFFQAPIWDRNQGTIQQAQADFNRQQAEIRRIQLRLERDLSLHFKQYLTSLQHVVAYQSDVLPEAEGAYQARLDAYKQRRETWSNVLDSQMELYQRQIEYVRHLVTWRESQTLIDGFLLTGGLDAPTNPTPPGHIDATPRPR